MKKYIIRMIGWIFDDDWYNYDGELDVEGVYNSKEEAIRKQKRINYVSFLNYHTLLNRYQTNFSNDASRNPTFVDVKTIAGLIAKKLNIEKEEIFDAKRNRLEFNNEVEDAITEELVESVLNEVQITFCNIIERESTELFFYHFKRNPEIWYPFCDKAVKDYPDHFYYFFDNRDIAGDNKRMANSIKECYELALCDGGSFLWQISNKEIVTGDLSKLSLLPDLLSKMIDNSKNINYTAGSISFEKGITAEELMALDTLLINPIIVTEKIGTDQIKKRPTADYTLQQLINKQLGIK